MKLNKSLALVMTLPMALTGISVSATEIKPDGSSTGVQSWKKQPTIINIDGRGYDAQAFMDRVLAYTVVPEPVQSVKTLSGKNMKFQYNKARQRIKKILGSKITTYQYDTFSRLKAEVLPDKQKITYSYKEEGSKDSACSLSYGNKVYRYVMEKGLITGLKDSQNKLICTYTYDKNGATTHIYEIKGKKKTEHKDNGGDSFVGCVNSIRYDGKCYDPETDMFCMETGDYYDTRTDQVLDSQKADETCHVDIKGLFGDQYKKLSEQEKQAGASVVGKQAVATVLPSPLLSELVYTAVKKYNAEMEKKATKSYKNAGTKWYTKLSSPANHYKLAARIIYAENTNKGETEKLRKYLEYNRQGVAWVITNRLLEDKYRKSHNIKLFFSDTSTPSLYSVLTKEDAFASLKSRNAKDSILSKRRAYQQALLLACYISVCSDFAEYNAVIPRPAGVTWQCYNKGALDKKSGPTLSGKYEWSNVRFPGDSKAYTGKKNYKGFVYYDKEIDQFNVLHSYKRESLKIQSVYYK